MKRQDFFNVIDSAISGTPSNQGMACEFLSKSKLNRYVIGCNEQSLEIISKFDIQGVVNDFLGCDMWSGVPTLRIEELPKDAIVLNCSTSISPVLVFKRLKMAGVERVLSFHELAYYARGQIHLPTFVVEQKRDYEVHSLEWWDLYSRLADQESKDTLIDVLRYRVSGDPCYMQSYEVRMDQQYFEPFLDISREVFVDAGGFDGATTEQFCTLYPDYQKVFLFEPSVINLDEAMRRLTHFRDINFVSLGLSDDQGTLTFNSKAGSASSFSEEGDEKVRVSTLDTEIQDVLTFIKMDLEGWEIKAIQGARGHILSDKPKLAVAVYHRASDFRDVIRIVLELNPNYRVFLRHYTQGWSETVMYFV